MNRYLDQLKSAKAPGSNPTELTQDPSVSFGGSLDSPFLKSKVVQRDRPFASLQPSVLRNKVDRLHALIRAFAQRYRLAEEATHRIIEIAKRRPAAAIPEDMRAFERDAGAGRCRNGQSERRKA